jgi:hypothetical protein
MCAVRTVVIHRYSVKRPSVVVAAAAEVRVSLHKAAVPEVAVMERRRASRVPRVHRVRVRKGVTDRMVELVAVVAPEEQGIVGAALMVERAASE